VTLHADALDVLRSWPAPSTAQEALRQRFVDHLEQHPDGTNRACRPDHLTASVLVLDAGLDQVLLTLHAKAGRWFQFGGHTEGHDRTLAGAALREAVEESGLAAADLAFHPLPVRLDAHAVPFCWPGEEVHHLDVMYAAVARDGARHEVSEESLDVAWWPVDALPDDHLESFVRPALEQLEQIQSTSESGGASSCAAADHPVR
jgi:8-oxo-dGTP pyrophosphatase MutT (NUDIX family)